MSPAAAELQPEVEGADAEDGTAPPLGPADTDEYRCVPNLNPSPTQVMQLAAQTLAAPGEGAGAPGATLRAYVNGSTLLR